MNEGPSKRRSALRVVAELGMIFLGITAALWFEDVNAARHERNLERQILREMSADLALDTADLHINLVKGDSVLGSIDTVMASLQSRAPYRDELAEHFGRASQFVHFFHNPAAYKHLSSAGLDVISSDSLRQSIIRYYDRLVPVLMWVDEVLVVSKAESVTLPQMTTKFVYHGPWTPAVPLDYVALQDDVEYQNALRMVVLGVTNQLHATNETLAGAETLLEQIEVELAGR